MAVKMETAWLTSVLDVTNIQNYHRVCVCVCVCVYVCVRLDKRGCEAEDR